MVKYYTLEEAARILQTTPDKVREMANKKTLRAFQDRGTLRFRADEVDERARAAGIKSDAEVELGEALPRTPKPSSTRSQLRDKKADEEARRGPLSPRPSASDSDVRLVMDSNEESALEDPPSGKSGPKSGGAKSGGSKSGPNSPKPTKRNSKLDSPSDSDVKLQPADDDEVVLGGPKAKSPSDSDIRLEDLPSIGSSRKGADHVTEEIDLDAEQQKAPASPRKSKLGKKFTSTGGSQPGAKASLPSPQLPTSSPFELSENDINLEDSTDENKPLYAPRPEIDSSNELHIPFDKGKAREPASDEIPLDDSVDLGALGGGKGVSGINLGAPRDSGISLEGGGSDELEFDLPLQDASSSKPGGATSDVDSSSEFELSVDEEPAGEEGTSSEFELTIDDSPQSEGSDSEFELTLDDESQPAPGSDSEFELSLDEATEGEENSSSEFELSLDTEGEAASSPVSDEEEATDSEFELSLDESEGDSGDKDIFEPTNFDVPALDEESGSEVMPLEEDSDFELTSSSDEQESLDEASGSEVVALEGDEEADSAAATLQRPKKGAKAPTRAKGLKAAAEEPAEEFDDSELVDEDPATPVSRRGSTVEEDEEPAPAAASSAAAAPVPWGPVPAILLFPTVVVMFVVLLMGFELTQGMWGYHKPVRTFKPVLDTFARMFDDQLPKD
jgi:excisionase family DNA binding protein